MHPPLSLPRDRWEWHDDGGLGPDLREIEAFLPAFYSYPALPLALALKGVPRLEMVAAWFLLAVFYGTFWYA
jgi:hypothetical protein